MKEPDAICKSHLALFHFLTLVARTHHYQKNVYRSFWFPAARSTRETIFFVGWSFYILSSLASCPSYNHEVAA